MDPRRAGTRNCINGSPYNTSGYISTAAARKKKPNACERRCTHRQPPAPQITDRERRHEHRDDAAPHIDAAAEVGRQNAAAQQLERHHGEAAAEGERVKIDEPNEHDDGSHVRGASCVVLDRVARILPRVIPPAMCAALASPIRCTVWVASAERQPLWQ